MAMSLVEGMSEPWQPGAYKDTYRDDVMAMIKKKVASKQIHEINTEEAPAPSGTSNVVDIMALLKQSLETKGKKTAQKPAAKEPGQAKNPATKPSAKPAAKTKVAGKTASEKAAPARKRA